jgi:HSP20 family protein
MSETASKLPLKKDDKPAAQRGDFWSPFEHLRREIEGLFDDFRLPTRHLPFRGSRLALDMPWKRTEGWSIAPAVDFVEGEKEYEISAELPGMDEKNIEVKLSNGTLTIKGEKQEEREEREKDYYLSERRFGSIHRSFQIPDGVDAAKIEATFANGLLKVKLPKTAEAQQSETKITVKTA